ncbi:GLIPR1-like protein 1 [Rhinatrema bivittatum]|uniref:GLIPR1-like protein 1 n=1 Tax=Rhinatrema bivittatum TaxID=194408 RepID=UPI00112D2127|nr:GLIPR1-like protein 1 [Rhinatrema bivittatum]
MASGRFLCLLAVLEFSLYCFCAAVPRHTDPVFIKKMVDEHNHYRSTVKPPAANMLHMSWDPSLAKLAKAWVKRCTFKHNDFLIGKNVHPEFYTVGENLELGNVLDHQSVVHEWASEVQQYDFTSNQCTGRCGHYTQIVWATTYKVGCAIQKCSKVEGFPSGKDKVIVACNYGPAGNVENEKPYSEGPSCSNCTYETCFQNLCRNENRDRVIDYPNWSPDWDKSGCFSALSYDSYCITISVLRPLLMIMSFGIDLFLH